MPVHTAIVIPRYLTNIDIHCEDAQSRIPPQLTLPIQVLEEREEKPESKFPG